MNHAATLDTGSTAGNLRTVIRDAAGRITGYSHTNNGTAQTSLEQGFGYDNLNRLLNASLGGSSTQYSYDATGNRTSKTIAGTTYTNTVATTSNRLTQTQDVPGTATIQYDAAGHITNDGTNSFTYSDRGRMTSATNAGGTVSYLYNGLNQRVYKSGPTALVNTGTAYFLYDEQGQLLGEYDANGAPVYETVYLGSMPVGVLKQAGSAATSDIAVTVYNVHADHIATARIITQQDQTIVWRWDTAEAFGGTAPDQNPSGIGVFTYNQRFPGQVFDAETGLFQNWNREYNARLGRYIQSDPIGLDGGINTFAYVGGNPLSSIDPRGLSASDIKAALACIKKLFPNLNVPDTFDFAYLENLVTGNEAGGATSPFTGAVTFSNSLYEGPLLDNQIGGFPPTYANILQYWSMTRAPKSFVLRRNPNLLKADSCALPDSMAPPASGLSCGSGFADKAYGCSYPSLEVFRGACAFLLYLRQGSEEFSQLGRLPVRHFCRFLASFAYCVWRTRRVRRIMNRLQMLNADVCIDLGRVQAGMT